jgi:hypothetical protein
MLPLSALGSSKPGDTGSGQNNAKDAEKIEVVPSFDQATVLKEQEAAAPGPIGNSLASRVMVRTPPYAFWSRPTIQW